ncbi:hypothetical protein [Microbacterium sp. GXF6406]
MHSARLSAAVLLPVGALILSGCTVESEQAVPTPSADAEVPAAYEGPLSFSSAELAWLLPDAADLSTLLPGAESFVEPSDFLEVISDGGGAPFSPAICEAFVYEPTMDAVAARAVSWTGPTDEPSGRLVAMQYPSENRAQEMFSAFRTAAESCGEFDVDGPAVFDQVVDIADGQVDAVAGVLCAPAEDCGWWSSFVAYGTVGNAFIVLQHPATTGDGLDTRAVTELLVETMLSAEERLIGELTENPPAEEEDTPASDASGPWGEWTITPEGIGPIRLGDTVEDALAAVPDVVVSTDIPGEWALTAEDGARVVLRSSDGIAVTSVMIGAESLWGDDEVVDGALLPSVEGIRVGDALSTAVSAFPQGTFVHLIAPGQNRYVAADRSGRTVTFSLDPATGTEPDSRIVGIILGGSDALEMPVFG